MKKNFIFIFVVINLILIAIILINLHNKLGQDNKTVNAITDDKEIINGYNLRYISACNVCIYVDEIITPNFYKTYISAHVYKYCYNDRYIGVQQVKFIKKKENLDVTSSKYYLIDTQEHELYSFNSAEEYDRFVNNNKITALCDWITTKIY